MKYLNPICLKPIYLSLVLLLIIPACRTKHAATAEEHKQAAVTQPYRASVEQINDLQHTSLYLRADFAKRELAGKAEITLKPHFYPVDSLVLDAKYMRILSVSILDRTKLNVSGLNKVPLSYTYDSLKLRIRLDRRYSRDEQYTVEVDYVAQPEKVKSGGSAAISGQKGLYFINHDGRDATKPTQLWTQGETEASSCWFPTIDAPNQRSSQEIRITVPAKYKTISNGRLVSSDMAGDSLRTDYWKQELSHAPYLFALVAGDFAEIKDMWREKPVYYYVEPAFEPYAKMVFGHTPEMLEYFSNQLGYDYPWDKYHQVVVRDFVSGAMENTGCVVHYSRLQHDSREHLDETQEDIIAHELFHHWFGDLLTCESWSNLPLNESFATYGEYLWNANKYGRDAADERLSEFHGAYFNQAEYGQENLIRYHYNNQEDMFDAHSYQKGASVLHMLRSEVGDEAFFAALKLYLHKHAFSAVELSDLRKAFEQVTGKDLNWFFNQWFLDKGHPSLEVQHLYSAENGYTIHVQQKGKIFRLGIDVAYNGRTVRVKLDSAKQSIRIPGAVQNTYVQFDAGNQLLAEIKESKSALQWEQQLQKAPIAGHRLQAFQNLWGVEKDPVKRLEYCRLMLKDSFHACRSAALNQLNKTSFSIEQIKAMAEAFTKDLASETKASVRRESVEMFRDAGRTDVLAGMLGDSSYAVLRAALAALGEIDKPTAMAFANQNRDIQNRRMKQIVLYTIARNSSADETDFFISKMKASEPADVEISANALCTHLLYSKPESLESVLNKLDMQLSDTAFENRKTLLKGVRVMRNYFNYHSSYLEIMLQYNNADKAGQKKRIKLCKEMALAFDAFYKRQK